jgi:hypothetical protein
MSTSQNGWQVLQGSQTRKWIIPGTGRHLVLNPDHAGFVLAHTALWYHERVERLDLGQWDEWGYALRPIVGGTSGYSNHASGTAMDLNAVQHPLGVAASRTFTTAQLTRIRRRLRFLRVLRWGGDYRTRPDAMHWEINASPDAVRRRAAVLRLTPRGRRVLKANPGYRGAA